MCPHFDRCIILNARLPDRFTVAAAALAAGLAPEDPKVLVGGNVFVVAWSYFPCFVLNNIIGVFQELIFCLLCIAPCTI